ncbi:MAG: hypothetical protein ABIT09_00270 [Croceibacterium sp.]
MAINTLKAQIARLEQRQEAPRASTSIEAAFADDTEAAPQSVPTDDRTAEQVRGLQTDLDAKRAQLKSDYAAQQKALVGPVQERINRGAQTFAASNGCAHLKMARSADLAALATTGSRNVTSDFVTWFAARAT